MHLRHEPFQKAWTIVQAMTPEELTAFHASLSVEVDRRVSETSIADKSRTMDATRVCPHCFVNGAVRNGKDARGIQRWQCRADGCGRTYGPRTGTPLSGMRHNEKWAKFVSLMSDGFISVSKLARKVGISRPTAWAWRKRFLTAILEAAPPVLAGTIEADETYYRRSFKGHRGWQKKQPPENRNPRYHGTPAEKRGLSTFQVMILTAVDSQQTLYAEVFPGDRRFAHKLVERLAPGSRICSDGFASYVRVAKDIGGQHVLVSSPKTGSEKRRRDKPRAGGLGLGRVDHLHGVIKDFVNYSARGVSSRYLPLYIAWLDAAQRQKMGGMEFIRRAIEHHPRPASREWDADFRATIPGTANA